jgi:hypothetical protein
MDSRGDVWGVHFMRVRFCFRSMWPQYPGYIVQECGPELTDPDHLDADVADASIS